ncbi:MAG: HAD family phosphatase [Rhodobacteraceae bacterium]|nr:MAG: HAD family phosphatase [Paracoccaceae bacterium]
MPALLFDLDGTMLNSDPIHMQVYKELWTARGMDLDAAFYMTHVHGRLNVDVFAEFLPDEPDPQGLSEWKEAQFRDRLPRPYPPMPGVDTLVARAVAEDWPRAIVTNAMRPNAEAMLGAIGLRDAFEVIVIGEECPRGKPDPYPYQEAMRQLGVTPNQAIAFEDSPSGARAARGSGAYTVGIRSGLDDHGLRQAGAHVTMQDFTDPALPAILERFKGVAA